MDKNFRSVLSLVLLPFSWLYGMVIWIRNQLYDNELLKAFTFPVPTISVGNLTVGGTGKTPHSEYLLTLLDKKYKTAYLSRGYKRCTRDFRVADEKSTSAELGDEALQTKFRFPETTVAVDRKRANGIRELMKLAPRIEVIVLDDAYQHRSVQPGLSLLLTDFNRPILEDRLLPSGMLRESARNRNRADVILVSKTPETILPIEMREIATRMKLRLGQHLFFTSISYESLVPVFPEAPSKSLAGLQNNTGILLVCGVAQPDPLITFARENTDKLEVLKFPDHQRYNESHVEQIMTRISHMTEPGELITVITTEKDAVKLKELDIPGQVRSCMYALRIGIRFLNNDKVEFDKIVKNYVESNKRSSILYKGK